MGKKQLVEWNIILNQFLHVWLLLLMYVICLHFDI